MNDHTATHSHDAPTPEGSTVDQPKALANGETRDTQLSYLEIHALLSLDKDIHSTVPDPIRQGLKSYFERHVLEIFVELPDGVVKLHLFGTLGEWDGNSVRYLVNVEHQGEIYEVPIHYTSKLDVDALEDPRLRQLLADGLKAAPSASTPDAQSQTTPDVSTDGATPDLS